MKETNGKGAFEERKKMGRRSLIEVDPYRQEGTLRRRAVLGEKGGGEGGKDGKNTGILSLVTCGLGSEKTW